MQLSINTISAIVIGIASIGGIVVLKRADSLMSIVYVTCLALFASTVFYVITVIVPEVKRKNRIRRGLSKQYRSFKKRCIDLFLISSNSQEYQERANLLDHKEFRRYFSICKEDSQSRWDLVTMSINDQDYIFHEIVRELDFFDREIEFARSSIEMNDEKVEEFFVNLRQVIHTIKAADPNSDDYKHFCRTLWSIFTRWNFIEGQLEEDIIERMIEGI